MVLDCAIDVCLPASFVMHSNRSAEILTRVGYVMPVSLSIVPAPCYYGRGNYYDLPLPRHPEVGLPH